MVEFGSIDGKDDDAEKQVLVPSSIRTFSADPSASDYDDNES